MLSQTEHPAQHRHRGAGVSDLEGNLRVAGVLLAPEKPVGEEQFGKGSRLTPRAHPGACRELQWLGSWELFYVDSFVKCCVTSV